MASFLIDINGQALEYDFHRRRRSRHIRVSVSASGRISLGVPYFVSRARGEKFLREKSVWVMEKVKDAAFADKIALGEDREDYLAKKEKARQIATERAAYFNDRYYGFHVEKVRIGNQKSRWGSCSASGVISYNYKIIYLPDELRDYIIVHEICHLKELNHSPRFWRLVGLAVPDWAIYRKKLHLQ